MSTIEIESILNVLLAGDCVYARKILGEIGNRLSDEFTVVDVSDVSRLSYDELMRISKCLDNVYWRINIEAHALINPSYGDAPVLKSRIEKTDWNNWNDYVLVIGRVKPLDLKEFFMLIDNILFKPIQWTHTYVPEHDVLRCIYRPLECSIHSYMVKVEELSDINVYTWIEGYMREENATLYISSEEKQSKWDRIRTVMDTVKFIDMLRKITPSEYRKKITLTLIPKIQ